MAENLSDEGWVVLQIPVPPELAKHGLDADIKRFVDAAIYKLRRNASKGRWEDMPLDKAFQLLAQEVEELRGAIASGSTSEILMESADVSNMALIVAAIGMEKAGV